MVTLNPEQDIRTYLDITQSKNLSVILSIHRNPLEFEPSVGTVDDFYLVYLLKNYQINEQFAEVWTKNISNKPLLKGVLNDNVYPTQNNTLEKIWAQISHRINFLTERGFYYSLNFNKNQIDLSKPLPHLPYSTRREFRLDEIMMLAKKEYWDYQRFTIFSSDDEHESKIFGDLAQKGIIHSA